MIRNGHESTPAAARIGPGGHPRAHRGVHGRGGRRLLAPLAGFAAAAALLAGCGGIDPEEPAGDPGVGTTQTEPTSEQTSDSDQEPSDDGGAGTDGPGTDSDDKTDDSGGTDEAEDAENSGETGGENDGAMGENLFEGTWGFGHDSKVLSAEELSTLLEQEADARGPEEMSLSVECGDGVDTGAGDYDAECIAYADEGVEHLWLVTVGPADAGLEVEVENAS